MKIIRLFSLLEILSYFSLNEEFDRSIIKNSKFYPASIFASRESFYFNDPPCTFS